MGYRFAFENSLQRVAQIVLSWMEACFAEIDKTVVHASAIQLLAFGAQDHGFGRGSRAGLARQNLMRVKQCRKRDQIIGVMLADRAGALRRIGVHVIKGDAALRILVI